jgi:DNA-binding protein
MSSQVDNSVREPNEIRVKADAMLSRYVHYALKCMKEGSRSLKIKGTGTATCKVLQLTEILKRRIGNLYQSNNLYSMYVESNRDGQDGEAKRRISVFESVLSMDPLDTTDIGYQEPVPKEESERPQQRRANQDSYRPNEYRVNDYSSYGGYYDQRGYVYEQPYPYRQHNGFRGMLSHFCKS